MVSLPSNICGRIFKFSIWSQLLLSVDNIYDKSTTITNLFWANTMWLWNFALIMLKFCLKPNKDQITILRQSMVSPLPTPNTHLILFCILLVLLLWVVPIHSQIFTPFNSSRIVILIWHSCLSIIHKSDHLYRMIASWV